MSKTRISCAVFIINIAYLQACLQHQQAPAVQIQNYEGPIYVHAVSSPTSEPPPPVIEEKIPQIILQTTGNDKCPPISVEYTPASKNLSNQKSTMCVPINSVSQHSCGSNSYHYPGSYTGVCYPTIPSTGLNCGHNSMHNSGLNGGHNNHNINHYGVDAETPQSLSYSKFTDGEFWMIS